ncbi:MAG TPA: TetR/AcrR family transcriptional regulator [Terracidiphilus sp.]|nr:TetR/AcrR family transcriptional regulator [Terracidiphilus sp.]
MATLRASEAKDKIVRAAVALFARQGFHGTSTREIARLADVSEVTVFRYFNHKDDIFWFALQESFDAIKSRLNSLDRSSRRGTPEVMLPELIGMLVDIATYSPELVRLIAVAVLEMRGRAEEVCRANLTPLFDAISGYLSRNIESGKMRNLNPAILTAAIALTVVAQPELSRLIEGGSLMPLGGREAIHAYSSFWLDVLVPEPEPAQ